MGAAVETRQQEEGQEGEPRQLQACQSDPGARGGYGADYPECRHEADEGQSGDQEQPAWVCEGQVLPD